MYSNRGVSVEKPNQEVSCEFSYHQEVVSWSCQVVLILNYFKNVSVHKAEVKQDVEENFYRAEHTCVCVLVNDRKY